MFSKIINRFAVSRFGGYSKIDKSIQLKSTSNLLNKKISSKSFESVYLSRRGSTYSLKRRDFTVQRRGMSTISSRKMKSVKKMSEDAPEGGQNANENIGQSAAQERQSDVNEGGKHDGHSNEHTHSHVNDIEGDHKHEHEHDHEHEHEHEHEHSLFSHSHSHSHHQPNELLTVSVDTIKNNPAVRITWIGLLVNIAMAVSKGVGGVYFHSQSLVADAIHSVSDMFADFLTLATVNVASKIGSPNHYPLGYGKIETLGSLFVSGILLFAGVSVGWSSLLQVFEYTLPSYIYEYVSMIQIGHSHSHSVLESPSQRVSDHGHTHSHLSEAIPDSSEVNHRPVPNINAAWLAGGSIWIKELLYRKTMKIAEETNSKVLVANAWHHRIDSLTALVALLTVTGGVVFNVAWLDSVGGLCVSVLIIRAGWGSFKTAFYEIIDKGEESSSETYDKIEAQVKSALAQANADHFNVQELSVLTAGANSNVFVTLSILGENQFSIKDLNQIESKIRTEIKSNDKFVRKVFIQFHDESKLGGTDEPSSHN